MTVFAGGLARHGYGRPRGNSPRCDSVDSASPRGADAEQNIIKDPDRHPHYVFEAEPHFLLAPIGQPLPGAGFRGTFVLAPDGFIDSSRS